MKVFLDLDNTLIFTRKFFRDVYTPALLGVGKTKTEIEKAYHTFSQGTQPTKEPFTPQKHMDVLGVSSEQQMEVLAAVQRAFDSSHAFLFSDAVTFLKTTKKEETFLLSYGSEEYQLQKIEAAGIAEFFASIYITDAKKDEVVARILEEDEVFVFVDDRENYFPYFQERFGSRAILVHMCHEEIGHECIACATEHHVKNYRELRDLLDVLTQK